MSAFAVNAFVIALLALIAFLALRLHRLFAVVMLSGAFSLTAAAQFVILDAVDVAFTEAAVGAGISTVLALATLSLVPEEEKPHSIAILPAFLAIATGALLMAAVSDLPAFGDPSAPIHNHVAPEFIAGSAGKIDVPNVVTSVLASYRGFDTLGEVVVVFTAAIAVLLIVGGYTRTARRKADGQDKGGRNAG
ncbi:MAG: DUF4040 domain-containing protein [Parvibaculales bacterium]